MKIKLFGILTTFFITQSHAGYFTSFFYALFCCCPKYRTSNNATNNHYTPSSNDKIGYLHQNNSNHISSTPTRRQPSNTLENIGHALNIDSPEIHSITFHNMFAKFDFKTLHQRIADEQTIERIKHQFPDEHKRNVLLTLIKRAAEQKNSIQLAQQAHEQDDAKAPITPRKAMSRTMSTMIHMESYKQDLKATCHDIKLYENDLKIIETIAEIVQQPKNIDPIISPEIISNSIIQEGTEKSINVNS